MKYINLSLLVIFIFLVSCKKNIDESMIIDPPPPPIVDNNYNPIVIPITSSVIGIVIDENEQPVEGATISLNNQDVTSDIFGSFRFRNAEMNENGTFLKIEKDGYFESGRRFFPKSSATHNVRIQLIEKNFNQSFQSEDGGTINFENGGEINFASNTIKTEDENSYSGEVQVALKWLDPTTASILNQMPGSLHGVTFEGEEMALETYGMIAVELISPLGEPLNIGDNQTAQIKMPVPSSLLPNAPSEIPLWAFNYQYGLWAEDGNAILQNGFYVGEVDHFSFWNCDFSRPAIDFSLTLINEETQEPLANTEIKLMIQNSGLITTGITNDVGVVSGKVPGGEELELQVLNFCDEIIHSQNIGPFTSATNLTLNINIRNSVVVSGKILDCNGTIATNPVLIVEIDGQLLNIPINNNPFDITIPTCQNTTEISVSGGDLLNSEQGAYKTFSKTDSILFGDLLACGSTLVGYGTLTIDSTRTEVVGPFIISVPTPRFLLRLVVPNNGNDILVSFLDNGPGDYSNDHNVHNFFVTGLEFSIVQMFENVEIIDYGPNQGDLISGKMSGYVDNIFGGTTQTVHASFEFSAKREQ